MSVLFKMIKGNIVSHGAEAVLIYSDGKLTKKRIPKGYRHPALDIKIRKLRTRSEARILDRASKIISVPRVFKVDEKRAEIDMQFIDGKKLSDWLDNFAINEAERICFIAGEEIAKLHNKDIIHGDLTTSNMIWKDGKVYLIDFGLSYHSSRIEDKAVDLHLLKQALESRHFKRWQKFFGAVIIGYDSKSNDSGKVFTQLKKVESRGRYRKKH